MPVVVTLRSNQTRAGRKHGSGSNQGDTPWQRIRRIRHYRVMSTSSTSSTPPGTFFSWIRSLGLVRQNGWLGGVCSGLAVRLGVDPVIVRGIVVVLAVFGMPVALAYAAAWLLLPDDRDLIHAEQLGRGEFEPALAGIGLLVLASLLPLTQGFWWAGAMYWGVPDIPGAIIRIMWAGVLITLAILFVVWLARRTSHDTAASHERPGTEDDRPATVPSSAADAKAEGMVAEAHAATAEPAPPPQPAPDASAEELAAWHAQQAEWRQQRAAWAAEQRRDERARRAEAARARGAEIAAANRERARIRRLTRPHVGAGYVAIVVGLAIVAASVAALTSHEWTSAGNEAVVGLAVAVLVLGGSVVVAGAWRRRSGVLSFFGTIALVAMVLVALLPQNRVLLVVGDYGVDTSVSGEYSNLAGRLHLYARSDGNARTEVVDLWQGAGSINVNVEPGRTVRIESNTAGGNINIYEVRHDGPAVWGDGIKSLRKDGTRYLGTTTVGEAMVPDLIVRVWQGTGSINIWQQEPALEAGQRDQDEETRS